MSAVGFVQTKNERVLALLVRSEALDVFEVDHVVEGIVFAPLNGLEEDVTRALDAERRVVGHPVRSACRQSTNCKH